MALFHYPNQLLESGEKGFWLMPILEVAVTTLQPALFALGTVYWPVKASSAAFLCPVLIYVRLRVGFRPFRSGK